MPPLLPVNDARCPASTCERGVGLIEVLVAVVLLSLGILGLAALQTRSLVTGDTASLRTLAAINGDTILDALRADVPNALTGAYNLTVTASQCPAAGSSLASQQVSTWCQALATSLGGVATTQGTVSCSTTGACSVTITWNDSRSNAAAGGGQQQLVTTAQL